MAHDDLPHRKHAEVLRDHLDLDGALVLDVGCGDGSLVRLLARQGASAIGLEPSEAQLARARAAEPAGEEAYLAGVAEGLPFPDGSFDTVIFFNALHHVPVGEQDRRWTRRPAASSLDGLLYVQEPIAEGDYFELIRPVEDETYVRAKAYDAIQVAAQGRLEPVTELTYLAPYEVRDFETLKARLLAVDPGRRERLADLEDPSLSAFEAAGENRRRHPLRHSVPPQPAAQGRCLRKAPPHGHQVLAPRHPRRPRRPDQGSDRHGPGVPRPGRGHLVAWTLRLADGLDPAEAAEACSRPTGSPRVPRRTTKPARSSCCCVRPPRARAST